MKNAIIYLRMSTDEQAESGLGLEAQEATARKWCEAKGRKVVAVHRDEGVSGTVPADKRSGLTSALASLSAAACSSRRDAIASPDR
jgi:DNA invertase Pin-like site-specific DNA recombinase